MATDGTLDITLILTIIVLLFILTGMIMQYVDVFKSIKHIRTELARASSKNEYKYWRSKLRTLYLCLIPGITLKSAKRIKSFISRGKHEKEKNRNRLNTMLLTSLLGIGISALSLMGSTFAWFYVTEESSAVSIQTAVYSVNVTVKDGVNEVKAENGEYSLFAGNSYTVTLTPDGTANNGYCIINLGGKPLYTEPLSLGVPYSFTLKITQDTDMTVLSRWGTYSKEPAEKLTDGAVYPFGASGPTGQVSEEATLEPTDQATPEDFVKNLKPII